MIRFCTGILLNVKFEDLASVKAIFKVHCKKEKQEINSKSKQVFV